MSDLVGNPEDRFSRVAAHILHDILHLNTTVKMFDVLHTYILAPYFFNVPKMLNCKKIIIRDVFQVFK